MHTIEKVVVVVELIILDEQGVPPGHTANRNNDAFFIALKIDLGFDGVGTILDRRRRFFRNAHSSWPIIDKLFLITKQAVLLCSEALDHVVI